MPDVLTACSVPRCPRSAEDRGRCRVHRRTTTQRGYGIAHQRIREQLRATLPARCGYGCGTLLLPDGDWHAAHRVDGHPELGYIASCVTCNERAKGGVLGRG